MKNMTAPDFRSWKLDSQQSLYIDLEKGSFYTAVSDPNDMNNPLWFCYVNFYTDPSGLANGRDYDILGKKTVIRIWGLKADTNQKGNDLCAVLMKDKWEIYPGRQYRRQIKPIISRPAYKVSAVEVRIIERSSGQTVLQFRIEK